LSHGAFLLPVSFY